MRCRSARPRATYSCTCVLVNRLQLRHGCSTGRTGRHLRAQKFRTQPNEFWRGKPRRVSLGMGPNGQCRQMCCKDTSAWLSARRDDAQGRKLRGSELQRRQGDGRRMLLRGSLRLGSCVLWRSGWNRRMFLETLRSAAKVLRAQRLGCRNGAGRCRLAVPLLVSESDRRRALLLRAMEMQRKPCSVKGSVGDAMGKMPQFSPRRGLGIAATESLA